MRYLLPLCFLLSAFHLQAQQYSRVRILLDETHQLTDLAEMGLDVDHGKYVPGRFFISEFSQEEWMQIRQAGFQTEVIIEDLNRYREEMNAKGERSVQTRSAGCVESTPTEYQTPQNYTYGSMGGYHTYQEMLDILDQMAAMYPDLFKARQPITTDYTTHEGRPVYWVKISDNPEVDETTEPEVLYTALHHAREPNSLSQMIFYMWYLLENYQTDPEVKYLVDHVEMYFVPCVNPDGYLYNEQTNSSGGGMWRKNRRDNGSGSFGVDLNRNYAHEWGFDDVGSSPNPNSETYRGPSAASEPEVRMIMEFCESHQFDIALNFHTYGNLLVYPWGYVDGATEDNETFIAFAGLLTSENNFTAGFGTQTVGYTVNGNSDDWMYGEQVTKNKIFSMTPEVGPGSTGFWPPQGDIDGLNKYGMSMNLTTARLVLNYGVITSKGERFIDQLSGDLPYTLEKLGLRNGLLKVSLEPVSDNVLSTGDPDNYGIFHLESVDGNISYLLDPSIEEGDTVRFNWVLDNGLYQWKEPVTRIFSRNAALVLAEPGDDLLQWDASSGTWAVTGEDYYSAPSSITDSPGTDYSSNELNEIVLGQPVQIQNAIGAYLSFRAKWDIEEDYDYVQLLASVNGGSYFPLCGKYTEPGSADQKLDEPLYDGLQEEWVLEEIDLSEYIPGDQSVEISFAFRLFSDGFIEGDGFYFDDLQLNVLQSEQVTATYEPDLSTIQATSRPNPADQYVYIDLNGEPGLRQDLRVEVYDMLGKIVASERMTGRIVRLETADLVPGIFQYRITDGKRTATTGRFVISRQ